MYFFAYQSRISIVFACINFPIDNIFCPFYPYPFSVFAEILPRSRTRTNSRTSREVRERAQSAYGTEQYLRPYKLLAFVLESFLSIVTGRLITRPRGGSGQEEILQRKGALTARIRGRCGLGRREIVEVQDWEEFKAIRSRVVVESKEEAPRTAEQRQDHSNTAWTDGSRLENGAVGAALAF